LDVIPEAALENKHWKITRHGILKKENYRPAAG
jgi:hypothetical protein